MLITQIHAHTIGYYCYCHHYFFVCALQVTNNTLVGIFKPSSLFRILIPTGREQWGSFSHIFCLNTILFWLNWICIFDGLTLILQDTLTVFSFSIFFTFLLKLLLWSHTISCWKTRRRKWGKPSCYVYRDKIVSNFTCLYHKFYHFQGIPLFQAVADPMDYIYFPSHEQRYYLW